MNPPKRTPAADGRKLPYQAPKLLVYGDMRMLTQTSDGTVGGMDMIDMAFKTGF